MSHTDRLDLRNTQFNGFLDDPFHLVLLGKPLIEGDPHCRFVVFFKDPYCFKGDGIFGKGRNFHNGGNLVKAYDLNLVPYFHAQDMAHVMGILACHFQGIGKGFA